MIDVYHHLHGCVMKVGIGFGDHDHIIKVTSKCGTESVQGSSKSFELVEF